MVDLLVESPVKGRLIPLTNLTDKAFASGAMGRGAAVAEPDGKVYAPFDGIIYTDFRTNHAIGIKDFKSGAELLIHIGFATVKLGGKFFTSHTAAGAEVKKGDLLIEFDYQAIQEAGYDITTTVTVINEDCYGDIIVACGSQSLTARRRGSRCNLCIESPVGGKLSRLDTVNDKAFASGLMGCGAAVAEPDKKVYAPFDGVVYVLFASRHAIGIKSESDGAELLIHLGFGTSKLGGKYFSAHVKQGDFVNKGDLLLEMDVAAIKSAGYDVTVTIVVTNEEDYDKIVIVSGEESVISAAGYNQSS